MNWTELDNVVTVFAIPQHDLAIGVHASLPSWTPSGVPPHPTWLGGHRAPASDRFPVSYIKLPPGYLFLPVLHMVMYMLGFTDGSCSAGDASLVPGLGKIPWRRLWQPIPVFLSGESHGQRSLVGCSPWVTKSQTQLKWLSKHACHIHGKACAAMKTQHSHKHK